MSVWRNGYAARRGPNAYTGQDHVPQKPVATNLKWTRKGESVQAGYRQAHGISGQETPSQPKPGNAGGIPVQVRVLPRSHKTMKKLIMLATATVLVWRLAALPTPPPVGDVTLAWDYPAAEYSTNLTFKIYHSQSLVVAMTNWAVLTNMPAPNIVITNLLLEVQTETTVRVTPGANFFSATVSNMWGESFFSNVASTPALPRSDISFRIKRVK